MSGENVSEEANLLVQKEQWAQFMADLVVAERGIDRETVLASARWACLWVDDYKDLVAEQSPSSLTEAKQHIETARTTSLERCVGIPRYPTGIPTLRAIIAAHDVFCLAFGEASEDVRKLLEPQPE